MFEGLLGLKQAGPITDFYFYLRHPWPGWVMLLVIVAAMGVAVFVYRKETSLSAGLRVVLGILRAVVFALVVLMLFEPAFAVEMTVQARRSILMLVDSSESMDIRDPRKRQRDFVDAALAMGEMSWSDLAAESGKRSVPDEFMERAPKLSRMQLVRGMFDDGGELQLTKRLGRNHQILFFEFGAHLEAIPIEDRSVKDALDGIEPDAKATALGTVVEDVVSRYGGQAIAGVIVFTDGASNQGRDPLEVARRMKESGIPVYTVGLGLQRPADVRMDNLVVQEVAFKGDEIPVRVQVHSPGFEDREVDVIVRSNGEEAARLPVVLSDRPQWVEVPFVPRKGGTNRLEISIPALPDETLPDNNMLERTMQVIDDKINVLYIEGRPRWEYRYLRQVLKRDHRLNVLFIIADGDPDLPRFNAEYLGRFPTEAAQAFKFDLIILGDVQANYFRPDELKRMEELVRQRGGSFLLIAGSRHSPAEYVDTVIDKLLPVKLRAGGWQTIGPNFHLSLTPRGRRSSVARLEMDDDLNRRLWQRVRPMYQLPLVEHAKPGAVVLLHVQDVDPRNDDPHPTICWHRYGTGKSMFVGTDQLWRMRFKTGDKYHARFWGQAIQFLTLSRLLGENRQISIQTDRKEYRTGSSVSIYANVLDETYDPVVLNEYSVYLSKAGVEEDSKAIKLEAVPDSKGLYHGFYTPDKEGKYAIRTAADDREASNSVEFVVRAQSIEQLQPALQAETLKKMAELSGGRYFTIRDLPQLPDEFAEKKQTNLIRRERELWDLPLVFLVILACAGLEWFLRRKYFLM